MGTRSYPSPLPWIDRQRLGLPFLPMSKTMKQQDWFVDSMNLGRLECTVDQNQGEDGDNELFRDTYTYCMDFNSSVGEPLLLVGDEDGHVTVFDVNKSMPEKKVEWKAHSNAIFDICWSPTQPPVVATASGDRSVKLWDLNNGTAKEGQTFVGYLGSVKCVQFAPDSCSTLASGSRDNSIVQWDLRNGKFTTCIKESHTTEQEWQKKDKSNSQVASVTCIRYIDDHTIISCSDHDGIIKVWDLRKSYDRYRGLPKPKDTIPFPGSSSLKGYSWLVLNSLRTKVYASCKDNNIYCFDVARLENPKPQKTFTGHLNGNKFFIRMSLSHDDRYLASGSSDNYAYIWNTKLSCPSTPIGRLNGHEADVTCVNFSKSNSYTLATSSDDLSIRTWRPSIEEITEESSRKTLGNFEILAELKSYLAIGENKGSDFLKNDLQSPLNKRRRILAPISLNKSPLDPQTATVKALEPFPCLSPRKMNVTPKKNQNGSYHLEISPRKIMLSSPRRNLFSSPTMNLPDIVKNGLSPHNQKKKKLCEKPNLNWLTSMTQQRKLATGGSPKTPKSSPVSKTPKSSPLSKTRGRKRKIL